jgi:hypothetical protein
MQSLEQKYGDRHEAGKQMANNKTYSGIIRKLLSLLVPLRAGTELDLPFFLPQDVANTEIGKK